MQRGTVFLFLSLILGATLSETFGLVFSAKEKRGWTLNSAGYLLGPHAVDNHRSFNDKNVFTGKREIQPDEDIKADSAELHSLPCVLMTLLSAMCYRAVLSPHISMQRKKNLGQLLVMFSLNTEQVSTLLKERNLGRPLSDENIMHTVIEFLTYLHLKELEAIEKIPTPEETNKS